MKPIPTRYKGFFFRSRLEARWAVFFDALGVEWEYEPEGFEFPDGTRYLPDFALDGGGLHGTYIEVKPFKPSLEELNKLIKVCEGNTAYGFMLWGTPGQHGFYYVHKSDSPLRELPDFEEHMGGSQPEFDSSFRCDDRFGRGGRLMKAVNAAKSARFEFGAKGPST